MYNPVYQVHYKNKLLRITSVTGHIMTSSFPDSVSDWASTDISSLFTCPIYKVPLRKDNQVISNLRFNSKDISELILWLDCDREGEAIAFDVIEQSNIPKGANVLRAHFSALTMQDISKAMDNLTQPNENLSQAVNVRQEIDLRIGASFTRWQTLNFQKTLGPMTKMVLSYGPC